MNELQYEELLTYAKSIGQFKQMVSSESKRPIAVRALMYVANINKATAWDFVSEYYDRMDLGLTSNKPHSFLNVNVLSTMNTKRN
jgi:hypothetical protein